MRSGEGGPSTASVAPAASSAPTAPDAHEAPDRSAAPAAPAVSAAPAGSASPAAHEAPAMAYSVGAYLHDRAGQVVAYAACLVVLYGFVRVQGVGAEGAALCVLLMALCGVAMLAAGYLRRARYFSRLLEASALIEHACELADLIPEPAQLEAAVCDEALSSVVSAANLEIVGLKDDARAERSYIELWIHEVKTPLAAMRLILSGMHGPEAQELKTQADRIEAEVEQALYVSRAADPVADFRVRETDLAEVVREACRRNASLMIKAGLAPRIDIPAGETVYADAQWLCVVLGQLIANSAKYGASTLSFRASEHDVETPQGYVALEVADDGWGISAADAPRAFERGFCGENGRKRGSSTGMGLYLVSRMCERMGLDVSLSTEEGEGTCVQIRFPRNRELADLTAAPASPAPAGANPALASPAPAPASPAPAGANPTPASPGPMSPAPGDANLTEL